MPVTRSSLLDDKHSITIILLAILAFSLWSSVREFDTDFASAAEEPPPVITPNILLIVADDLGYDDTSALNSNGLPTPNIRQLAQEGVTFSRHYADSTCTPSRVAILSGRYPERSGFRPVGSEIPAEFLTIAEQLQRAGYSTNLTGKWHAGEERLQAWPQNKGFDHWFGFLNQWELAGEITDANKGQRRPTYHNPMLREQGGELHRYEGHLTDILTDHTIRKIEQLQAAGKPWFLYHAFLAPHQPIQPHPRFAEQFPDTPEGKYTALVTQLDDAVGRIVQAVDRKNTLIVFVSDNGGTNSERNNNFPFFGKKNEMYEGAFRTPLIMSWPENIPQGKTIDDVVMNVDIYPTLLAAAKVPAPPDLDGSNLWPLFLHDNAIPPRRRSWEVYSANVNTLNFSYLPESGDWRLASLHGFSPGLFDLLGNPSGEEDVASQHPVAVAEFTAEFWREHWRKSLLAVSESPGTDPSQTLYSGFDAMRTPQRFGFTVGLEIGPLPVGLSTSNDQPFHRLAGQEGLWDLRFIPGQGLEWHMGDVVLTDPYFEPARCNAIILTGYFEPVGHLSKRAPQSTMKLYSSGFLRDANSDIAYSPAADDHLDTPTFVNFHGKARFSNTMLSSFADSYSPRVAPQFADVYTSMHRERKLTLLDVKMMDAELCQSP
ncbi:MAG: sulfatase-like hydrolase/transferase [Halioglobus sp.]|nr:sulfatase-like hydrolase/transferase [Halioglobus sp.]